MGRLGVLICIRAGLACRRGRPLRPWAEVMRPHLILAALLLAGCASTPTVTPIGSTTPATTRSAPKTASPTAKSPRSSVVPVNPPGVLPDPARTPGAVNPLVTQENIGSTICVVGWTKTQRPPPNYTTALKIHQLETGYAYKGDRDTRHYEEDHLIPLELGGSPKSVDNLWPEPYATTRGARSKDKVENKLKMLVCTGRVKLRTAQRAIASNWIRAYDEWVA